MDSVDVTRGRRGCSQTEMQPVKSCRLRRTLLNGLPQCWPQPSARRGVTVSVLLRQRPSRRWSSSRWMRSTASPLWAAPCSSTRCQADENRARQTPANEPLTSFRNRYRRAESSFKSCDHTGGTTVQVTYSMSGFALWTYGLESSPATPLRTPRSHLWILVDTRGLMKGGQAHQNKSLLIPLFHATDYKNLKLQPQTYQNQRRLLKLQCSGPSATWAAKVGRVLV